MPLVATRDRILITNGVGQVVLDTNDATMRLTNVKKGFVTLPRVAAPPFGLLTPATVIDADVDLGAIDPVANVLGGTWRITNAEGLNLGEIRNLGQEGNSTFTRDRFLYAPRLLNTERLPAGGVSLIDNYRFLYSLNPFTIQTSGSNIPEVGIVMHSIQFVIDNGRLKLLRRGSNIVYQYIYLSFGSFPTQQNFAYLFDCAALTIEYSIWLGAFT